MITADELLTTTRAVRKRLDFDREVPRNLIEECLEIAIQAPTGSNQQSWKFMVLTDPEPRRIVAEAYKEGAGAYMKMREENPSVPKGSTAGQMVRVAKSSRYLMDNFERVPVLLIPLIDKLPGVTDGFIWSSMLGSILPATWSYMLAARARGLGTSWTTLHLIHADRVSEALGIPDHLQQVACIPTAFYTGEGFSPAKRRPVAEITHWNRW